MKVIIETDDCPDNVRAWICEQIQSANMKAAACAQACQEYVPDRPSMMLLQDRARAFLDTRGRAALDQVLQNVGINRVSECPPDKYVELLQEIDLYA
jgi:hypothetical protein